MSSFSTIACYAALNACSGKDIIRAYARMVASLVGIKRYKECDASVMCRDFVSNYGFELPYHPMCTVILECIKLDYFAYNQSTHKTLPNYENIDKEDFMQIVAQKDEKYKAIIAEFKDYLIREYNFYASTEDLNDKILAFIERYGIKSKEDKKLLRSVKDDFYFADFLVYCEENDRKDIMDYLDEYTVGLSLSELFIYCDKPELYTSQGANVYLDTGIVFRIFGISSADRRDSYVSFLRNMQHLGMKIWVYEHTVNEIIGIVEGSKAWVGNIYYDQMKSSEATDYFIQNNWSIKKIDAFSTNLKLNLQKKYNISIDCSSYPREEDIITLHEADIHEMIIQEYIETRDKKSGNSIEEKEYSIEQDAKSIFFTQHKNGKTVPIHINEVKNIFVTTNRSLAKVGYKIGNAYSNMSEFFIPSVMTDIKWGTLLWFNSPAKISAINRPRLVSAAYAAFRPSSELAKTINHSLSELVNQGDISPEECYLLKTNPIAQRLFAKKTANNPENYVDSTPFEILQEIGDKAFKEGSMSRQEEIDTLSAQKDRAELMLAIEKQTNSISYLRQQVGQVDLEIKHLTTEYEESGKMIDELSETKEIIDKTVKQSAKRIRILFSLLIVLFIVASITISVFWDLILGIISFVIPAALLVYELLKTQKFSLNTLIEKRSQKVYKQQCSLRRYSESKETDLIKKQKELETRIAEKKGVYHSLSEQLKEEELKLDNYSIDISLMESQ